MLGPVSSHTAAETRQVVASLGSQPTVAGHSGDHPPELETLRATPARPHQILIQGNLARRVLRLAVAFGYRVGWGIWTADSCCVGRPHERGAPARACRGLDAWTPDAHGFSSYWEHSRP